MKHLRFVSIVLFLFCTCQSFSQKTIVFKASKKGKWGNSLSIVEQTDTSIWSDSKSYCLVMDSDHTIATRNDYLIITPTINYNMPSPNDHPPARYSCISFDHIQSFPRDTIILGELSFTKYKFQNLKSATYLHIDQDDSVWTKEKIKIKKNKTARLRKSIPYPHINVTGSPVRRYLKLKREINVRAEHFHGQPRKSWTYTYDELNFTFSLDLSDLKK